jgi:hypothetical protein
VLTEWWNRLMAKRHARAEERADELQHMSPEERRFFNEGFETRVAGDAAVEHLSGGDQASPELEN